MTFWIILGAVGFITVTAAVILAVCFYMAFYVPNSKKQLKKEFDYPPGDIYEPYYPIMTEWMKSVRSMPCEDVCITSFDKTMLHAKYYEHKKGAPIELMFHGYRGSAERDLCGGVQRCFELGNNALIVDQRASGLSGGNVISFGINESKDCACWVDYIVERFGPEQKIILTGISMGAATVVIAAGRPLPENVVGVLADCGYTGAKEMIIKTIDELKLPSKLVYPMVKLSAKLFGRFDLEETTPEEQMANCRLPIVFVHGESDDFVPAEMSRRLYDICKSEKMLYTVKGAGHGLAYPKDTKEYLLRVQQFWQKTGIK